ncbi:MAG TPA: pilus assembly PilX N-terminal domain-containing protein [Holophagaceae bacterium]|jgi:hypothetical protein|nr:pilus assembly PilX N-terminal domain-containing protein [Holophagaceae bacterium]
MHRSFQALLQHRASERGGITIVVALVLIVLMSLAAFSLSRNSIREMATTGNVIQGDKASAAADAGLDWFVVWSHPDNVSVALSNTAAIGNNTLAKAITDIKRTDWYTALGKDGLLASTASNRAWDMAALVKSQETQMASNDMVFDNTANATVLQSKNNTGNPVVQSFNLQVRFLGFQPVTLTGGGGNAAGGTNQGATGSQDTAWQVVSTGNAAVPIGNGNYLRYQQRREMIGTQALSQSTK